jgi:hypothetical protein
MDDLKEKRDYLKLIQECVEVDLEIGGQSIKGWLRVLTTPEQLHADMLMHEAMEMDKNGSDEKYIEMMASVIRQTQMLYYSLRSGPEQNATRMFRVPQEVLALGTETHKLLAQKYHESFVITEEDLGNSLRARIHT